MSGVEGNPEMKSDVVPHRRLALAYVTSAPPFMHPSGVGILWRQEILQVTSHKPNGHSLVLLVLLADSKNDGTSRRTKGERESL